MRTRSAVLFLLPLVISAASADAWEEAMTKAGELTRLGRFSDAHAMYVRAAAAVEGTPTPELAQSVTTIAIARLQFEEGRTRLAEQTWSSELARLESSQLSTIPLVLVHLSELYIAERRYDEAEKVLIRCSRWNPGANQSSVTALSQLATIYDLRGRHPEAATALVDALSLLGKQSGDQTLNIAVIEYKLANAYSRLGRIAEADEMFEHSLELVSQRFGPNDGRLRVPATAFAEHLQRTGRKRRAKELRKAMILLPAQDVDARRHTVDVRSLRREP